MDIPKFIATLTKVELKELEDFLHVKKVADNIDEQEWYHIQFLALKEKQKQQAWDALKNRETGAIPIIDFIDTVELPCKLKGVLKKLWDDRRAYYLDDISRKKFLKIRHAGVATWNILMDSIKTSLKGTRFEVQQAKLTKHFEWQESLKGIKGVD